MIKNRQQIIDLKIRNYILNTNELLEQKVRLCSKPLSMEILLTNKCNLRCDICNFKNYHDGSLMDKNTIEQILKTNPQLITVEWSGGGEPLLHPYMEYFIDLAYSLYIKQILITNGLLLNDKIIEKICKYNINLILSIDGHSKNIYEKLRKNGNYDKLVHNLQILSECRKKYRTNSFLRVYYIVVKDNYKYLLDMLDFIAKYKISEIFFKSDSTKSCYDIVSHGTFKEKEDLRGILQKVIEESPKKSITCMLDEGMNEILFGNNRIENIKKKHEYRCLIPWQQVRILPKGEVVPTYFCCKVIGNINFDSLDNLWNSDVMIEYRTKILNYNSDTICNDFCLQKDSIARTHSGIERFLHTLLI